MSSQDQPTKAFPREVMDLKKQGVPLPTLYSGPLYCGNGSLKALKELQAKRAEAGAASSPDPPDDDGTPEF